MFMSPKAAFVEANLQRKIQVRNISIGPCTRRCAGTEGTLVFNGQRWVRYRGQPELVWCIACPNRQVVKLDRGV